MGTGGVGGKIFENFSGLRGALPPPEPPTRRPPTSLWPCPKNSPPRPCQRMASSPKKSLPRICVYVLVHAKWYEFCENFRIPLETSFLIIVEIYLLDTLPPLPQPHSPLRVWPCPCMLRDYCLNNRVRELRSCTCCWPICGLPSLPPSRTHTSNKKILKRKYAQHLLDHTRGLRPPLPATLIFREMHLLDISWLDIDR